MANICITSLTILPAEGERFDDVGKIEAIRKDLEDNVVYDGDTNFHSTEREYLEMDTGTRWAIPTEELVKISMQHEVKIRAIGREDGCSFVQVVCVDETGKVVQDDSIDYAF
jgi:hypothetical protein